MTEKKLTDREIFERAFADLLHKEQEVEIAGHENNSLENSFDYLDEVPSMTQEEEARAVSIGVQEIREMINYMFYTYRSMISEFTDSYRTFPILLKEEFDMIFSTAHEEAISLMEDMQKLIAGDIKDIIPEQNNYSLYNRYDDLRYSVLNEIFKNNNLRD